MTDLRLYDYSASANCYKVRLLLALLDRPYERVPIDIFDGDTLSEEYGRINPHRTTPVLELPDGELLLESAAILFHLGEGTRFLPEDPLARARVLRWLVFEQTDVVPAIGGLRFRLQTERFTESDPDAIGRREYGEEILDLLDEHLAGSDFFVGPNLTVADIALYGYIHVGNEAGYDLAARPNLSRWLDRIRQEPRYIDDLSPYPANARPGAGQSTYD